jgi:hypothetical protein
VRGGLNGDEHLQGLNTVRLQVRVQGVLLIQ